MFKNFVFTCFVFFTAISHGQSDLQLTLDVSDFANGIAVNDRGKIGFEVTNNGPDDVVLSQDPIRISGLYNRNTSSYPIRFFSEFQSNDSNCFLTVTSISPPPPFINYVTVVVGSVHKSIPAYTTVNCQFTTSIQYVDTVDMQWKITPPSGVNDSVLSNNSQYFTFRGLAAPVLINYTYSILILVLLLLICTWRYRLPKVD